MIRFLKALVAWADVATALIIYSADLKEQDRAAIKMRLMELKDAVLELENNA